MARFNEEELPAVEKPQIKEVPICVTQEEMFNFINQNINLINQKVDLYNQKLDFIIEKVK